MTAIVVLGMHRSGTSAVTRALNLLGASLGPPDDLGQYWESAALRRVNEALLAEHGGAWDCPPALPAGWEDAPVARALVADARAALAAFGDADAIAWKDPRTCLTMPFWAPILGDPVVILIHRHPAEVAGSLGSRNDFGEGLSFALWERYNAEALRGAAGLRTAVVAYPALVERPQQVMEELVDALRRWGVELPRDPRATEMELSAARRHHRAAEQLDEPIATGSQRALFARLRACDGFHDRFEPGPVPEPEPLSAELVEMERRLRASRVETRRARTALRRLSGSRRELLRRLLRPERSAAARPGGPDPSGAA